MGRTLSVFMLLVTATKLLGSPDIKGLEAQLTTLEDNLRRAEYLPGEEGLQQAMYYEDEIQKIRAAMSSLGITPTPDGPPRGSVVARLSADELRRQELESKLDMAKQELATIQEDLKNPSINPHEVAEALHEKLKEKMALEKALGQVPETVNGPPLSDDDPYIAYLQDQLQHVYDQIFFLKEQTLKATDGIDIQQIGYKISDLEEQEASLKKELLALGIRPAAPLILRDPERQARGPESPEDRFESSLQTYLLTLEDRIASLRQDLEEAASGHHVSSIGQNIRVLEENKLLALKSLEKEKKTISFAIPHQKPDDEQQEEGVRPPNVWAEEAISIDYDATPLWKTNAGGLSTPPSASSPLLKSNLVDTAQSIHQLFEDR